LIWRMCMLNKSLFTSSKSDWETPDKLFDRLNNEFEFTIDVCASATNKKVDNYFSVRDNALVQEWTGICWMNPPYGKDIKLWVKKAYTASLDGETTVVCLLPCRTDTVWWHEFCMKGEIRFCNKRLKFKNSNNMATFPSAIVVFGKQARVGKLITTLV